MKSTFCNARWLARSVRVILALTALAVAGSAVAAQPQPKSPVGPTWDCVLSGARNGVAYITFAHDGTFSGYEVLVPTPPPSPQPALVSVATSGNGLGLKPSAPATNRIDLFGACPVSGTWGFDSKGRIVGSFLEVVYSTDCTTTAIPISTNLFDSLEPIASTNAFPVSYSVTFPLSTNKDAGTFKNQTICYLDQVAVSTNCFDAFTPCCETNVLAKGFSVTTPASTNMVVASYTELTSCYATNVVIGTSSFESLTSIAATNTFPDGSFCIIRPVAMIGSGNYLEEMTCYAPVALIGTNISNSPNLIDQAITNSDGTFCIIAPIATNAVSGTFRNMTVSYAITEDCGGVLTNTVSFVGTVSPGKRLTLLGTATLGRAVYVGVPAASLPNISGAWYGVKQQNRMPAYEFLDLRNAPYAPNSYAVSGNGAGYSYSGLALLSSQKKIALACDIMTGTNYQCTRAVIGAFSAKKVSASAAGLQAPSGTIGSTNRVTFQFSKRTSMP